MFRARGPLRRERQLVHVAYAPASQRDLRDIGDFIALENGSRARKFVVELRAALKVARF